MLRINLLGDISISEVGDDGSVSRLAVIVGPKQRELVAWLALEHRARSRSDIAHALWPDTPEKAARTSLRRALADLNASLGEQFASQIFATKEAIGLANDVETDVAIVGEASEDGRLDTAYEFISRGPLAPDLNSHWLAEHRDQYEHVQANVFERLAHRAELIDGDLSVAIRMNRRWRDVAPLSEPVHRELARRYLSLGDRLSASEAIGRLNEVLAAMSVEPSEETKRVIQQFAAAPSAGPISATQDSTSRDELLISLGSADVVRALEAAALLAREALGSGEPRALPASVATAKSESGPSLSVTFGAAESERRAVFSLTELRGLLADRRNFQSQALGRAFLATGHGQRKTWSAVSIDNDPPRLTEEVVETELVDAVVKQMRQKVDVVILGKSGSGKSIAARSALERLTRANWKVLWLDASQPDLHEVDALRRLNDLRVDDSEWVAIALDDVQSNPGVATRIAQAVRIARQHTANVEIVVVATAWNSARSILNQAFREYEIEACNGQNTVRAIFSARTPDLPDEDLQLLFGLVDGDALLAELAADYFAECGKIPTLDQLAELAYGRLSGESALETSVEESLYMIAALGQFEIDPARDYVQSFTEVDMLRGMQERRLIRSIGDYVTIGHRTYAGLVARHLEIRLRSAKVQVKAAGPLAVDYLKSASDDQIISTLERLDLAGTARSDQHGSDFLVRAWSAIRLMSRKLATAGAEDPTWGDNIASTVHASETFAIFDPESWSRSARFIAARLEISETDLPKAVGEPTAERVDFDEIRERMLKQDAVLGKPFANMDPNRIDFDRMHRTWLLGQLLGFEGHAPVRNRARIDRLVKCARANQNDDGSFYPARVPWVTARVVLGLASVGALASSDDVVRRACDWLRTAWPEGPLELGVWESGTGTWNTPLQSTAMCVAALAAAGIPSDDSALKLGRAYVVGERKKWTILGREMDAADSLEVYLQTGGRWRAMHDELMTLFAWAREQESWEGARLTASEAQEESSKLPRVTSALISVLWATVKSELPVLLEDIAVSSSEV